MAGVKRGEIYWCNLDPAQGHEKSKTRPVLIIQNYIGNIYSPTTIGVVLTSEFNRKDISIPTNVLIVKDNVNNLTDDSLIETNQIRVFDVKTRLGNKIGELDKTSMMKVDKALKFSLELIDKCPQCNFIFLDSVEKCPKCGITIHNKCNNCKALLDVSWIFCPQCGEGGKN